MLGDVMLSEGLLVWGIPGLCIRGLGEDVQPGEGAEMDGDFRWTGEAAADPITGGDLIEAAAAAAAAAATDATPDSIPASWEGV